MTEKIQPIRLALLAQGKPKKKLHKEILKQMVTLTTSGFGLVAALAPAPHTRSWDAWT